MMDLTVAKTQLDGIAKALGTGAEVIIMDEPTSALGESEADQLFAAIARLKAAGKGVICVSHRLTELFEVADRSTAFRDGAFVEAGAMAEVAKCDLVRLIVSGAKPDSFAIAGVAGVTDAFTAVKEGEMTSILPDARAQAQGALDLAVAQVEDGHEPQSPIWQQTPEMKWGGGKDAE